MGIAAGRTHLADEFVTCSNDPLEISGSGEELTSLPEQNTISIPSEDHWMPLWNVTFLVHCWVINFYLVTLVTLF